MFDRNYLANLVAKLALCLDDLTPTETKRLIRINARMVCRESSPDDVSWCEDTIYRIELAA